MEFLYRDDRVAVCIKPTGVLSTDEPGGMPALIREALGDPSAVVRTVHRLDRTVGGVMVFARTARAAADLGRQMQDGEFYKEYRAVVHGTPEVPEGVFRDLLRRDRRERKTYVTDAPGPEVREAVLDYRLLGCREGLSLVAVRLHTGRTHQIRCQFSSRGLPLAGDRKYGGEGDCPLALWSHKLQFYHPRTGEKLGFSASPPDVYPWNLFSEEKR